MSTSVEATMQDQLLWYSVQIKRYDATTRAVFSVWGPSASVPGGAPLGGFCDRFWGRDGIIYILSILIRYLSIQLSILLSIIWCKNKWCKKMSKMSSYFITAVYKCLQANRKRHKVYILNKKALKKKKRVRFPQHTTAQHIWPSCAHEHNRM